MLLLNYSLFILLSAKMAFIGTNILVPEQHVIHVITDPKWFDFHAWGYKPTKDDQFDTEVANLRSLYELLHTRFGRIFENECEGLLICID